MSRSAHRRATHVRRAAQRRSAELHVLDFDASGWNSPGCAATVRVRGRMRQVAAIGLAHDQARALGHGSTFCTGIRTVPAPRPTPALDALACKLTAFPTFVALLTTAAGYRPSIRLDLLGREGLVLARLRWLTPSDTRTRRHGAATQGERRTGTSWTGRWRRLPHPVRRRKGKGLTARARARPCPGSRAAARGKVFSETKGRSR